MTRARMVCCALMTRGAFRTQTVILMRTRTAPPQKVTAHGIFYPKRRTRAIMENLWSENVASRQDRVPFTCDDTAFGDLHYEVDNCED